MRCRLLGRLVARLSAVLAAADKCGRPGVLVRRNELHEMQRHLDEKESEVLLFQQQLSGAQRQSNEERVVELGSLEPAPAPSAAAREAELLRQLEDLEDRYQQKISDIQHELDAAKTENLTLCLEMRDVGQAAQQAQQDVRSSQPKFQHAVRSFARPMRETAAQAPAPPDACQLCRPRSFAHACARRMAAWRRSSSSCGTCRRILRSS